ncbi:MAG TPA: AAA family ATPase [Solirubrobacteraceae bacterium]
MALTNPGPSGGEALLDRRSERAVLLGALEDARAGRGRTVTVAGDAGIGKTRLLDLVAAEARASGTLVAWGRCWDSGGAPGFWPWTQVLRAVLDASDGAALLDEIGPAASAWLTQLVPEHVAGAPPSQVALEGEQARFELFEAVRALLSASARGGPLVVLLEDLHAADVGSLRLLEMLAATLTDSATLILASYRELELRARPDAAAALTRVGGLGATLEVPGLPRQDLAQLIAARAGRDVSEDVVGTLHRFTDGNPLYAEEIVRMLAAEGGVERLRGGDVPLPLGVGETIRRRLGPLTGDSIEALSTAAVIGREFRLRTLEHVIDSDRDALLRQLSGAISAGVLVADRSEIGRYRFSHALFREALYEDLAEGERARLHGEVAAALEVLYGDAVERRLSELAHHYLAAAPLAGMDKAIDYATRAGHRALAAMAYEEAAEHFHRALGALGLVAADDARRGALLLALGNARVRAGDTAGSRSAFLEAAELARTSGDPEALAHAALGLVVWGLSPTTDDEGIALLDEALDALGDRDAALRARLLARLSAALGWSPDVERRRAAANTALELSQDLDERTRGFVLMHATIGLFGPDTLEQRVTNAAELQRLGQRTGELEWQTQAVLHRIPCALEVGDGPGVVADVDMLERLAGRVHQPRLTWLVPCHRALLAMIEGRWEDFEALAGEAVRIGTSVPGTVAPLVYQAQLLCIRWMQGRITELSDALNQAAAAFPGIAAWRTAQALAYAEAGREARATSTLGILAADGFAALPHDHTRLMCLGMLAETCVLLDDRERGAQLVPLLAPFEGRHLATAQGTYGGPVNRHLGQLAGLAGDLDEALDRFGAARVEAERMNAAPYLARIALDEGLALARAADARAGERLARAARLAEELAMPQIAARVSEAQPAPAVAAAAATPPAAAAAEAQMRREGDVWAFEYAGRTTRVRDAKGLRYIAALLRAPGDEVHALALVGGDGAATGAAAATEAGLSVGGSGGAGPALDAQAKREYRARVTELEAELEEAREFNDPERVARAREELEFIANELSGAVGLGGRDRETGSNAERARVNATRAIRTQIKRVAELDPELGHELEATLRTGTFCVYEPDPRRPLRWRVDD